ncbi:MAG: histidine phosphatase family protein [Actinomycetota bacterium]|nr:histidine phosphatase family protein [Actinomycetota bacterium]
MSERTVVHLMRHGEVHNPGGVLYGRLPGYHLSDLGQQMAVLVGEHLAAHDVVRVVASSLERAQETAGAVAAPHVLPVSTDDRVIEAGNWFEGKTFGAGPGSLARPAVWPRLVNPFRPSWGEPYTEIAERMLLAVTDARAAARGHEVVLVSHQLPIWTTRCRLEGRRLWHDPRSRECSLASLTSLEYADDELRSITYSEPARRLLPGASAVVGA